MHDATDDHAPADRRDVPGVKYQYVSRDKDDAKNDVENAAVLAAENYWRDADVVAPGRMV